MTAQPVAYLGTELLMLQSHHSSSASSILRVESQEESIATKGLKSPLVRKRRSVSVRFDSVELIEDVVVKEEEKDDAGDASTKMTNDNDLGPPIPSMINEANFCTMILSLDDYEDKRRHRYRFRSISSEDDLDGCEDGDDDDAEQEQVIQVVKQEKVIKGFKQGRQSSFERSKLASARFIRSFCRP